MTAALARALNLLQPWASLVAIGAKQFETRSWSTKYRGPLAIAASKGFPRDSMKLSQTRLFANTLSDGGVRRLPFGCLLCVVDLVDCIRITENNAPAGDEYAFGDYTPGRWMWRLENVRQLETPIACKGALGLWTVPPDVAAQVLEQLP